jgi:hypothetical protein
VADDGQDLVGAEGFVDRKFLSGIGLVIVKGNFRRLYNG